MKLSKIASAMPFAHFLGLPSASAASPSAAARAEEDEDRKQREDESDDEYAKRMEEQDKKDEEARKAEQEEKDKEAKRAEETDDDVDAEADDKDDKEEGKRAGRAKGARQRERVRCAAIVAEGMKRGMVKQACAFAFDTNMSASEAINALSFGQTEQAAASPSARKPSLDERMAHARPRNPGDSAPAAAEPTLAERIIAAGKLRRGEL
ncbi:hypothetical protein [Caballeronia sp. GAFFF3]|uniref:hypothetical protein n=1 Tax=Caballeronia sp. GAFFF3 TaxID=2921759 RepID=UPI0020296AC8|nr:hypothetical protein [Caballeronia sp. GAFFF3]